MTQVIDIKELMRREGLKQYELAKQLGVSNSYMSRLVRGLDDWPKAHLETLEAKYDVKLSQSSEYIVNEPGSKYNTRSEGRILHVPIEARAGFLGGVVDPVHNQDMQAYDIPGISFEAYSFEVTGDSMEPTIKSGEVIITTRQPIKTLNYILNDYIYVICSPEEILIKRINRHLDHDKVWLESDNQDYEPIEYTLHPQHTKIYQGRRMIKYDLAKNIIE